MKFGLLVMVLNHLVHDYLFTRGFLTVVVVVSMPQEAGECSFHPGDKGEAFVCLWAAKVIVV